MPSPAPELDLEAVKKRALAVYLVAFLVYLVALPNLGGEPLYVVRLGGATVTGVLLVVLTGAWILLGLGSLCQLLLALLPGLAALLSIVLLSGPLRRVVFFVFIVVDAVAVVRAFMACRKLGGKGLREGFEPVPEGDGTLATTEREEV